MSEWYVRRNVAGWPVNVRRWSVMNEEGLFDNKVQIKVTLTASGYFVDQIII